jgi:hypothetical protein
MPYKRAMARAVGMGPPLSGLATALVALSLWVAGVPLRWLDGLCATLYLGGALAATVGCVLGRDTSVKRLAVLALGANALPLAWLALVWLRG